MLSSLIITRLITKRNNIVVKKEVTIITDTPKRKHLRNPNGFGTVYQLSNPTKRRRPWVARVPVGWTKTGKPTYHTIGYFATRPEALKALAAHWNNPVSPKANITLEELYKEWSSVRYEKISASTERNYLVSWKYLSQFAKTPFRELRAAHIQQAMDAALADGKSRSTIEKIKAVAVMLGNYAVQNDIANKNYAQFAEMPKLAKQPKDRFTDLEIAKIAAVDSPWTDSVMILLYSGLRLNEMLGLTRFQVDLEQRIFQGAGLKTDAGRNRIIPILDEILPLVQYRYSQAGSYLFPREEKGGRCSDNWYRKNIFYPLIEKAGVRRLTPHCCRHTFASLMAGKGVPPAAIQAILGHTNFSTTADNYVHLTPEQLHGAVANLKYGRN